jgi:hypothetical protein
MMADLAATAVLPRRALPYTKEEEMKEGGVALASWWL